MFVCQNRRKNGFIFKYGRLPFYSLIYYSLLDNDSEKWPFPKNSDRKQDAAHALTRLYLFTIEYNVSFQN